MSFLYIVIIIQFAIIFYIINIHAKERKDLYDRIMSNGLGEYQKLSGSPVSKGGNFIRNRIKKQEEDRRREE